MRRRRSSRPSCSSSAFTFTAATSREDDGRRQRLGAQSGRSIEQSLVWLPHEKGLRPLATLAAGRDIPIVARATLDSPLPDGTRSLACRFVDYPGDFRLHGHFDHCRASRAPSATRPSAGSGHRPSPDRRSDPRSVYASVIPAAAHSRRPADDCPASTTHGHAPVAGGVRDPGDHLAAQRLGVERALAGDDQVGLVQRRVQRSASRTSPMPERSSPPSARIAAPSPPAAPAPGRAARSAGMSAGSRTSTPGERARARRPASARPPGWRPSAGRTPRTRRRCRSAGCRRRWRRSGVRPRGVTRPSDLGAPRKAPPPPRPAACRPRPRAPRRARRAGRRRRRWSPSRRAR